MLCIFRGGRSRSNASKLDAVLVYRFFAMFGGERRRGKGRKEREERQERKKDRRARKTESKKDREEREEKTQCVDSKRLRVYRQNARMFNMRRFAGTHGGVLNAHTEAF